ncbi:unnamed protein product, partial [Arabidopsis halleri]
LYLSHSTHLYLSSSFIFFSLHFRKLKHNTFDIFFVGRNSVDSDSPNLVIFTTSTNQNRRRA